MQTDPGAGNQAFLPSFGQTPFFRFLEPTFGASEAGASNGNGVSQSQKAFVPCKVCGDKASGKQSVYETGTVANHGPFSGYHYGVTSCEGCKVCMDDLLRATR